MICSTEKAYTEKYWVDNSARGRKLGARLGFALVVSEYVHRRRYRDKAHRGTRSLSQSTTDTELGDARGEQVTRATTFKKFNRVEALILLFLYLVYGSLCRLYAGEEVVDC